MSLREGKCLPEYFSIVNMTRVSIFKADKSLFPGSLFRHCRQKRLQIALDVLERKLAVHAGLQLGSGVRINLDDLVAEEKVHHDRCAGRLELLGEYYGFGVLGLDLDELGDVGVVGIGAGARLQLHVEGEPDGRLEVLLLLGLRRPDPSGSRSSG